MGSSSASAVPGPGRVFVGQSFTSQGGFAGLYHAYWVSDEDPQIQFDAPSDMPLVEAIAWGRERSNVVLVALFDAVYSAGAEVVTDDGIEPLTPSVRLPKPGEWYEQEHGAQSAWTVHLSYGSKWTAPLPALVEALRAIDGVRNVRVVSEEPDVVLAATVEGRQGMSAEVYGYVVISRSAATVIGDQYATDPWQATSARVTMVGPASPT